MRQILFFFIACFAFTATVWAQSSTISPKNTNHEKRILEVKNSFWHGLHVVQNGERYSLKQTQKQIMDDVPEAYDEMRNA